MDTPTAQSFSSVDATAQPRFAGAETPCILLCAGKSCRNAKGFDELKKTFDALATVKTVKCVAVCDGPVAGVRLNGKTVWFERLKSEKVRRAVAGILHSEPGGGAVENGRKGRGAQPFKISKRLREHRV